MADVFISYAHDDAATARELQRALLDVGLSVFEDQVVLVAGTDFSRAIADSLRSAKAVVVLLSANTRRSRWVQEELTSVIEAKPGPLVIPVLLDRQAKDNWVWPLVADRQAIDLTDRPTDIAEVAARLRQSIPRSARDKTQASPQPLPPFTEGRTDPRLSRPSPVSSSPRRTLSVLVFTALFITMAVLAVFTLAPMSQGPSDAESLNGWLVLAAGAAGVLVGYLARKWRE